MDGKRSFVHGFVALNDLPLLIDKNQIADSDEAEVHTKGIDPKAIKVFGVAGGNVTGNSFIKPEACKETECCG